MTSASLLRRPATLIVLVALTVRCAAALLIDTPPRSDAAEYVALARSIAAGEGFARNGEPTAYRMPGYPLVLAAVFATVGEEHAAVRLLQALVDSLTCLLVIMIGRRLADDATARRAGTIYALFPLQVLYVSSMMTETLFTALATAVIALLVLGEGSRWRLLLAGILAGAAVMVKPAALVLCAVVPFAPGIIGRRPRAQLLATLTVALGLLAVTTPWMLRNRAEFGRTALTSNAGINFWIGNHPGAHGGYLAPGDSTFEGEGGEFRRSDAGLRRGLAYWAREPVDALLGLGRKHAHFFGIDYWILLSSLEIEGTTFARAVAKIPATAMLGIHLPLIGIVILALVALAAMPRETLLRWGVPGLWMLLWLLVHLVFFGSARLRVPAHPMIVLAAAAGWLHLRSGTFAARRRALPLMWFLLLAAGWAVELWLLAGA